MDYGLTFIL